MTGRSNAGVPRRRVAGDRGQAVPLVAMLVVASLAGLGLLFFQYAGAADLRSGAQTAADAAALAAVRTGLDEVEARLADGDLGGAQNAFGRSESAMRARAAEFAARNDASVEDIDRLGPWQVAVAVRTDREVANEPAPVQGDRRAQGAAQAELRSSPDLSSCRLEGAELPAPPPAPAPPPPPPGPGPVVLPEPPSEPEPLPVPLLLRCTGLSVEVGVDGVVAVDLGQFFLFEPRLVPLSRSVV